jgi:hypothetical protein
MDFTWMIMLWNIGSKYIRTACYTTGMAMFNNGKIICILARACSALVFLCSASPAADHGKVTITCESGLLSVTAENVNPEALFSELMKNCKVQVVTHGNVFPKTEITLKFKDVPVEEGMKRLVKACGLRNYLINYPGGAPGKTTLVKLELFLGGTGELNLMPKSYDGPAPVANEKLTGTAEQNDAARSSAAAGYSNWDGSALIDFPEYRGQLPYDTTNYQWDDRAKAFVQESMNIIPPEIRDGFAGAYIKECEQIARQKNSSVITPEITAEALESIAKKGNMPPAVMKNIPKTIDDFQKPRIRLP